MQYHTDSAGPDAAAFRVGFVKAIAVASRARLNEVIFLVHTLQMLQGGVFEEVLGQRFVGALAKNKVAGVEGVRVHLETERLRSAVDAAVVFAPFVSEKLLMKALADRRAVDLIYVPWAQEERLVYLERFPNSVQV